MFQCDKERIQIFRKIRILTAGLIVMGLMNSCVLQRYQKTKKDLANCVGGVKMPADEFCGKWNENYFKQYGQVWDKLEKLQALDSIKFLNYLKKIHEIDAEYPHLKGVSDNY